MAVDALWRENAVDHNAVQYRQMLDGLAGWRPHTLGAAATSGTANGGVLGAPSSATTGPLAVTERGAGANMSVDVAVGGALVWGTAGAGNAHRGAYFAYADATENVAITAADATNPRIDLVGIRIRDTAYGEADNTPVITVVTGTPAGVPAEPAVPDNFLTLARVDVPALDTAIQDAQITDRRRGMSALGGMAVVASSASYPAVGLWDGQMLYDIALASVVVRAGGAWAQVGPLTAWTSYTPTLTQPGAIAKTVTRAKYFRVGRFVHANANLNVTGAGTGGNNITVGLPVTGVTSGNIIGDGRIFDASVAEYPGAWWMLATTTIVMRRVDVGSAAFVGGADPNFALANTDVVDCNVFFEAAS